MITTDRSSLSEGMLSSLVPVLTLSATLLHSVLGCCWHHGHDVSVFARHETVSRPAEGCGHHHHRADSRPSDSPQEPCDHRDGQCHEPSCVYLVGKHFEMLPATASHALLMTEVAEPTSATADASVLLSFAMSPPGRTAPELRALLQVWLI